MQSIHELFTAAKSGDRGALDDLIRLFRPKLSGFCLNRMGKDLRQVIDVNDVLQDTSLKALESLENVQWQGEGALFSWFCGIAQNVIYGHSKRLLRIRLSSEQIDTADEGGTSPSQHVRREERFDRLEHALHQLTQEQQQAIRLTRIQGVSVREAALRMNRSEKATYQLLWRAVKKLREVFGETVSVRLPADRSLNHQDHD